jgi:pentatricopeptide repeat domain-containing protein 1
MICVVLRLVRSLPDEHDLRCLCDIFTYTTMISQCNSHQQLRRALELVAEMRSRAIPLNVHTYSALLNVCLKANELDLSLDVYAQMLAEGCTPNLVTYNTLLDIYNKAGRWVDALHVLELLQHQVWPWPCKAVAVVAVFSHLLIA